jgi:hypothetical protein
MARRELVHWPRQAAESHGVWSSTADGALRIILRHSSDLGWRQAHPSNVMDRLLPIAAMAIAALSGIIIGWVLFVP